MKMIVRPSRLLGESPLSFLVRTAEANGYSDYRWLLQLGGVERPKNPVVVSHRDQVAAILRQESQDFLPTRKVFSERGSEAQVGFGSDWLPAGYLEHEGARLCPQCLKDNCFRHALWDLKAFTCCPHHALRLLDTCPGCMADVKIGAGGQLACGCGMDLRQGQAAPAAASEVALHQWFAHLAGLGPIPKARCYEAIGAHLRALSLRDLVDVVLMLGWHCAVEDPLVTMPRKLAKEWTKTISAGADMLADWPDSFLAAVRKSVSIRYDGYLSHRDRNRRLYRAVASCFSDGRFDFLRDALDAVESEQWGSFRSRLHRHLPEEVKEHVGALVGAGSVASELALPENSVVHLAREGVLSAVTREMSHGRLRWFFAPDTARRLLEDMEKHAVPAPDDGFTFALPLFKARQGMGFHEALPWLVQRATAGQVPLVGRIERGHSRGLNACFFDHRKLLWESSPYLQDPGQEVSVGDACRLLRLKDDVRDWLIAGDYFRKGLREPVGETLTVEQFWRFFEALVVPGHVIFGRKTGVRPGKAGLDQIKAIPFATSKGGSPAILYWRWDVERKLAAYMAREQ